MKNTGKKSRRRSVPVTVRFSNRLVALMPIDAGDGAGLSDDGRIGLPDGMPDLMPALSAEDLMAALSAAGEGPEEKDTDGPETELGETSLKCITQGRLSADGDKLCLSYEEIGDGEHRTTRLYFSPKDPSLLTMAIDSGYIRFMTFNASASRQLCYVSDEDAAEISQFATVTHKLVNTVTDEGGIIYVDFDFEIDGADVSRSQISIAVLPITEKKNDAD